MLVSRLARQGGLDMGKLGALAFEYSDIVQFTREADYWILNCIIFDLEQASKEG